MRNLITILFATSIIFLSNNLSFASDDHSSKTGDVSVTQKYGHNQESQVDVNAKEPKQNSNTSQSYVNAQDWINSFSKLDQQTQTRSYQNHNTFNFQNKSLFNHTKSRGFGIKISL